MREGLAVLLSRQPSIQIVGSADEAVPPEEIAGQRPDVLLLDVSTPDTLEFAAILRGAMPGAKIVALGVTEVEQVVLACARVGVSGFVYAHGTVNDVVAAVQSAVRGELVCSPRTAGILLNRISSLAAPASLAPEALTRREQEIMTFVNEGLSNKQIATRLGICDATVKNHVHSILGKLRVRRRGEAAAQLRQSRPRSEAWPAWHGPTVPHGSGGNGLDRSA